MTLLIAYELILMALRLIKSGVGGFIGAWPLYLGVLVGSQFGWLDGWVRYFIEELLDMSRPKVEDLKKAAGVALGKLRTLGLPHKLLTRNVLFMPMWLILAIFAFTSTSGWFPRGIILGIGLQWFYWPLKHRPKEKMEKMIVLGYAAVFCLASFLI